MAFRTCDLRDIEDLRTRWDALAVAQTPEATQTCENNLVQFFRARLQQPSASEKDFLLSPVQELNIPEQDKIRVCAIAARALFASACASADPNAINEAIRNKLEGYSKSSSDLSQELNCACSCLNTLPPDQKTPKMVETVMGFLKGLKKGHLDNVLQELQEIPEEMRVDYFRFRRNKDVLQALALINTDKSKALPKIISAAKASQNNPQKPTQPDLADLYFELMKALKSGQRDKATLLLEVIKKNQESADIRESKLTLEEKSALLRRLIACRNDLSTLDSLQKTLTGEELYYVRTQERTKFLEFGPSSSEGRIKFFKILEKLNFASLMDEHNVAKHLGTMLKRNFSPQQGLSVLSSLTPLLQPPLSSTEVLNTVTWIERQLDQKKFTSDRIVEILKTAAAMREHVKGSPMELIGSVSRAP